MTKLEFFHINKTSYSLTAAEKRRQFLTVIREREQTKTASIMRI